MFGVFDDETHVYLILEYLEDGSLYDRMKSRRYHSLDVELFEEKQSAKAISDILKGLSELHGKYIIHRDIKP